MNARAADLWDQKFAEYLARGQDRAEAKRNATEFVARIHGPPRKPVPLDEARHGVVRDLGHAAKWAHQVWAKLEEIRKEVNSGALTAADIRALDRQARQLLTYAGYITRAITRARRDLQGMARAE